MSRRTVASDDSVSSTSSRTVAIGRSFSTLRINRCRSLSCMSSLPACRAIFVTMGRIAIKPSVRLIDFDSSATANVKVLPIPAFCRAIGPAIAAGAPA